MAQDLHEVFSARDLQRLVGTHPDLIHKLGIVFGNMRAKGNPMFVAQAARTADYQNSLYQQGRTTPGPDVRPGHPLGDTVTNADGYKKRSNHQAHEDGLGWAVDSAFLNGDPFGEHQPWGAYGAECEAQGLVWGGHWKTRIDRPHVELA